MAPISWAARPIRAPKGEELITMSGGWISLTAVAKIACCSTDEAKLAFEKEL